ncbi:MAG: CNNM domain-containing protein [Gammaproteobacteria bacterium]
MTLLILFFVLSIVVSFLCSIWEAVLLSVTPSYVNSTREQGGFTGRKLTEFTEDIDRPLSAILTLNTIAHTVGAIGVGAQASKVFGSDAGLSILGFNIGWASVIAAVMTLAILIFSEIIPKTIGANNWRELAPFSVRSIDLLITALGPFVWLSQGITKRLKTDKSKSVYSRADFSAITNVAEESGALALSESTIIKNLLRLDEIAVNDIMTPRTVMITANEDMIARNFYKSKGNNLRFSRIPLFQEKKDNITGYVLKDDILVRLIESEEQTQLKELRRDILHIKPDLPLPKLFDVFTENREQIAIVLDDYGSLVGLVTMEDVVETLLGLEIVDEMDAVEDLQQLARQRWQERAKRVGLIE